MLSRNIKDNVLLFVLFSSLFLLTIFKMRESDTWFHMKAGEVISKSGSFIYKDIFSFTIPGQDWLYHEWLFGVMAYHLYSLFGENGLILGKAVLLTIAFVIIYQNMRLRGINQHLASFLILIGVLASRWRFTERPHIFKFLFIASFIYLLDRYRLKDKNWLWLIPILQAIWTNTHGSFILGPVIVAIYLLSELLSGRDHKKCIYLAMTIIASLLITTINPYGIKLIYFSLNFLDKSFLASISEWRPTGINDFFGGFGFLFIIGIVSFFARVVLLKLSNTKRERNETAERTVIQDAALLCLFSYLSLKAIRFTALYSLSVLPLVGLNLQFLSLQLKDRPYKKYLSPALGSLLILLIVVAEFSKETNPTDFGFGFDAVPPERAVRFIKNNKLHGNMYNSYEYGGYLIWSMYPDKKVFIDGRTELYERKFKGSALTDIHGALDKYDINLAFLSYLSDPIADQIINDVNWILIYWDDVSRIYVKDVPLNKDIIARNGHKVLRDPFNFNETGIYNALRSGFGTQLELELKRDIANYDKNIMARLWLGVLYQSANLKIEAISTWEDAIEIEPHAYILNRLGQLYVETGNYSKAVESYQLAIESDKDFILSHYNLGIAYEFSADTAKAAASYKRFLKMAGPEYAEEIMQANKRIALLGS